MKAGKSRPETKNKRLSTKKEASRVTKKAKTTAKDPNKPKKPSSSFFVFMEEYRKLYKAENPHNKSVAAVGKAGGEKWKSMSESEKAPFETIAEKRKQEYDKQMNAFNKGEVAGKKEEESEKSMSEVNDEDDDGSEEDGEEDD